LLVEHDVADVPAEESATPPRITSLAGFRRGRTAVRSSVVGLDQVVAEAAVTCDLNVRREPNLRILVEVARAARTSTGCSDRFGDLRLPCVFSESARRP